jgi:hypothetical protein
MVAPIAMLAMLGDIADKMSAWKDNDLIAGLLMAIFIVTLGIGAICLLLVIHFLRSSSLARPRAYRHYFSEAGEKKSHRVAVGLPSRWLAIKSSNPVRVQQALHLHKPTPCSWADALAKPQEQKLFISPPVAGWVLVFGSGLPEPSDDVDKCFKLILDLSRKVGQVQFFSINRSLNHHAWAKASHGEILRAYAWAGQTLWNQGAVTPPELDLDFKCFDYAEPMHRIRLSDPNPFVANTEKVPALAARWSIDPAAIAPRTLRESHGIAGELTWRKSG